MTKQLNYIEALIYSLVASIIVSSSYIIIPESLSNIYFIIGLSIIYLIYSIVIIHKDVEKKNHIIIHSLFSGLINSILIIRFSEINPALLYITIIAFQTIALIIKKITKKELNLILIIIAIIILFILKKNIPFIGFFVIIVILSNSNYLKNKNIIIKNNPHLLLINID